MHSYGAIGGQIASSSGTSGAAGARVSKDVLRGLQDVVWSDDEVRSRCWVSISV
jgi:hypothetical protein